MKNMNKLFGGLLLAFGLGMFGVKVEASVGERMPEPSSVIGFSTVISSITPFTVVESTTVSPFQIRKPGAVYQVNLSSGAAGDYCILYDTTTATGLLPPPTTGTANYTAQFGPRLMFGSTTANTTFTFDPPLLFLNGLMVGCSSASSGGSVTYGVGRGISGF